MELSAFHAMVSSSLRRGTTLDVYIPQQTVLAAQWLERNYSMKYMETFRMLQIEQGERVIQMPANVLVKAAKFIRLVNTDGTYNYLNKIEPEDLQSIRSITSVSDPTPHNYYIVGLKQLVLDSIPQVDASGEGILYEYSSWPSEPTATHPMLDVAADLLLAQVQMFMAVNIMKDLRMVPAYKELRDEAVNTLTRAEDETKYGGEAAVMAYTPN
jgi:hypothetical protein